MIPDRLTLIIYTYNRPQLLARAISFYAQCKWESKIIIADSSTSDIAKSNEELINKYSNRINATYLSSPSTIHPGVKGLAALEHVETEYVVLHADDDLLNPVAADSALEFLVNHKDYSVCNGYALLYYKTGSASTFRLGHDYSSLSIEDNSPMLRWIQLISAYSSHFYGVRRTSDAISSIKLLLEFSPDFVSGGGLMSEVIDSTFSCMKGKIKRLPVLYSLRKGDPPTPGFEKQITHPDFSARYASMKACIAKLLVEYSCVEFDLACSICDDMFALFIKRYILSAPILENGSVLDAAFNKYSKTWDTYPYTPQQLVASAGSVFELMQALVLETPEEHGSSTNEMLETKVLKTAPAELLYDDSEIIRRAEEAIAIGQFVLAEDLCRQIVERAPETPAAWALLGMLAKNAGNLDYAAELLEVAISIDPNDASFHNMLGDISYRKNDHEAALAAFSRAIENNKSASDAWLGQAIVFDRLKNTNRAEESYKNALLFSKDSILTARILLNYAGFLKEHKRLNEATDQLAKAVSLAPDSLEVAALINSFIL